MGKPLKKREELTLQDFVRLKGSRWKSALTTAGCDIDTIIAAIAQAEADIPAIVAIRCCWIFDVPNAEFDASTDWLGLLYTAYMENEEEILNSVPTVGETPEVEEYTGFEEAEIVLQNSELVALQSEVKTKEIRIKECVNYRQSSMQKAEQYLREIYQLDIKIQDAQESIELLKTLPAKTYNVKDTFDELQQWCTANNAFMYKYIKTSHYDRHTQEKKDRKDYSVNICVPPQEMRNVNNPTELPIHSQPLHFRFHIHITDGHITYKLEPAQQYNISYTHGNSTHPHVASYVCWGDQLDAEVYECYKKHDIAGVFDRLVLLIQNYNSGSPFVDWEEYKRTSSYEALLKHNSSKLAKTVQHMSYLYLSLLKTTSYRTGGSSLTIKTGRGFLSPVTLENFLGRELYELCAEKLEDCGEYLTTSNTNDLAYCQYSPERENRISVTTVNNGGVRCDLRYDNNFDQAASLAYTRMHYLTPLQYLTMVQAYQKRVMLTFSAMTDVFSMILNIGQKDDLMTEEEIIAAYKVNYEGGIRIYKNLDNGVTGTASEILENVKGESNE